MEVDTKTGIIYCWRNVHNGKRYIGQTINPKDRFNRHKHHLGNYDGQNLFGRALNKYSSMDDWEYTIIEEVPKEVLDEREIYWIAFYNSNNPEHGYNMATGGDRHDGYKHSEETRRKISEALKGNSWNKGKKQSEETIRKRAESNRGKKRSTETCKKISESLKGKKRSTETCKKISESLKGKPAWNKGKKLSHEARKNMSNARNPNRIAIYQNDTLITICDTIAEASHIADVSRHAIDRIIAGRYHQTKSGYSFKYISKSA